MSEDDPSTLARVWDLSPDMLCVASPDGYLKQINPSFTRILGWSEQELKARPFLEFVHTDDRDGTVAETERLANGESTIHFENRYRCKDGSWRWLSWRCEPHGDDLIAVARDVTDRKRFEAETQERARAETAAKTMERVARQQRLILNAASHELNTPLTPMVFDLALLEAHVAKDQTALRAVDSLGRNVRKLQATIASLIHVSQLATEQLRIQPRPIPVRPLLEQSARASPAPECPEELEVYGDRPLLEQAVNALIHNAEQHGGGVAGVAAKSDGGQIRIEVQDKGPGFEADEGEDWFLPLHRGVNTQALPGTGLGLTMVRLVATAHNGLAGVASPGSGQGTTAWMTLPRAQN